MIIDATNLIMGRLASFVAKQALKGETIDIINAENVVMTGSWKNILKRYEQKRDRGHPYAGPFFQRQEHRLLKKTIVGMLPHKQAKGRAAAKRVKCYLSSPQNLQNKHITKLDNINILNTKNYKYVVLKDLCKALGKK